jgi:alpha-tubulin suppressor-like RCC1 family protein
MGRYRSTCAALVCASALSALTATAAWASGSPGAAAWGGNSIGQLGDGTMTASPDPVSISGLTNVTAISAARDHGLALLSSGKVMAWGDNASGELGNATRTSSDVPVEVKDITDAIAIAAGGEFSLALLENGTVMAWGQNGEGQLGDGNITNSDVPVAVNGLTEVTAIGAGLRHSLALLQAGTVKAWGADNDGQLGNGTTANGEVEPVPVSELTGVKAIAAGGLSSYAVLTDGNVEAWGDNGKGQLGDGSTTNTDLPAAVKGVVGATSVGAGSEHALALVSGGTVYAWGDGSQGELGNGTENSTDEAVQVSSITEATAVASGGNFSLALLASGVVDSWGGDAEGQLGNGNTTSTDTPGAIPNLAEVKGIAAGGVYGLAYGPALPNVTGVSPSFGPASGGTPVTITGTGFNSVTSVHFGSASVTPTVESETRIHVTSPVGTGVANVTVTVPGGTSPRVPADRFSYTPVVSGLSPNTGPQSGGTEVVITGSNLEGVSAVKFGANPAKSFKDESGTEVIAFSAAGVGTVDVTLTGPGGTSEAVVADKFTYGNSAPELGRCKKASSKKHTGVVGKWRDPGCTEESSEGKYEWEGGAGIKNTFKTQARGVALETAGGISLRCTTAKGAGEYFGARGLKDVQLKLIGCKEGRNKCTSAGAAKEGEVSSAALAGEFGVIQKRVEASEDVLGLDLSPESGVTMFEFVCGSTPQVWRGSVIATVKSNKMSKDMTLTFAGSKGLQVEERFEGGSIDDPENSTGGAAFEKGAIVMALELKGHSEIEINSVH